MIDLKFIMLLDENPHLRNSLDRSANHLLNKYFRYNAFLNWF